ncbi:MULTISPECIES: hypothetical protein [unclassified Paenibacillus]|uniref:hypothetical protein n=1 Tax=unclassified Paenibacillus TaxID=185978 RepID=UPI0036320ADE
MSNGLRANSKKPAVVTFAQILLNFAAVMNLVNGFYSFGNEEVLKKALAVAMIIFGAAAIWAATRLALPAVSGRKVAIGLSWILIALRLIEFAVWHNLGFLLGLILPLIVLWRLNSDEAKAWYDQN